MSNYCNPSCLVDAPNFDWSGCSLQEAIRSGFIQAFVATRCDTPIADLTDVVEIEAAITALTMFVSPPITGEIPFPSMSDGVTENCKPEVLTKRTYSFNWDSVRVDNASLEDFTVWNNFDQSMIDQYNIAPLTCDGILLTKQGVTTDTVPGFSMRGVISTVFANTNTMSYRGEMTFIYNEVLNGVQLSDEVLEAMGLQKG